MKKEEKKNNGKTKTSKLEKVNNNKNNNNSKPQKINNEDKVVIEGKNKNVEVEKKQNKRTKSDEYYDELTRENKIIKDLEVEQDIELEDKVDEEENYSKSIEKVIEEKEEPIAKVIKPKTKISKNQLLLLNIQFIFSIITLILAVTYFFQKRVMFALQISLGLTMMITGVNNLKVYKRKSFTVLYFVLGIALFVIAILNIMGI